MGRKFREGLKMLKKSLIALLLVAFASAPAMAHYTWAATTTFIWEWEERECMRIPVKMYVVMWAKCYLCDKKKNTLILVQQSDAAAQANDRVNAGDFYGCICLELCVNFKGITMAAEFVEDVDVAKKYTIYIDSPNDSGSDEGEGKGNGDTKASIDEMDVHLTGNNLKPINVCLKAKDVDPQALEYKGDGTLHNVGTIIITLQPIGQAVSGGIPPYIPGA